MIKIIAGTFLSGSEHNDEFYTDEHGRIRTRTNRSGGIQVRVWFDSGSSFSNFGILVKMYPLMSITFDTSVGDQGGISNGEIINLRIAFKPTSTIGVSLIYLHAPIFVHAFMCMLSNLFLRCKFSWCKDHVFMIIFVPILFGWGGLPCFSPYPWAWDWVVIQYNHPGFKSKMRMQERVPWMHQPRLA
jgi:hypothetical protein